MSTFVLFQADATKWACWPVKGPNTSCPPVPTQDQSLVGGSPSLSQLSDYIRNTLGINSCASFSLLENSLINNWKMILPKVQAIVNADFARTIATNAGTILASAHVPLEGRPLSPFQVLKNISAFMDTMIQYRSRVNNPQLPLTLSQEKQKIDNAIRQLSAPDQDICPAPVQLTPVQCQNQRLVEIFNIFNLQNGIQVFLTDMNDFVSIDLQNRFMSEEIPTTQAMILRASGQDLSIALEATGLGDLDPLAADLNSARSDIESNIQLFRQFFVDAFKQVVKREAAMAQVENVGDGANRPHAQRLGELCMLWPLTSNIPLSTDQIFPNWPDGKTQRICTQTLYFNENGNADTETRPAFEIGKLEQQVKTLPFQKRVCIFHKYKIKNKVSTLFN